MGFAGQNRAQHWVLQQADEKCHSGDTELLRSENVSPRHPPMFTKRIAIGHAGDVIGKCAMALAGGRAALRPLRRTGIEGFEDLLQIAVDERDFGLPTSTLLVW